MSAKYLSPKQLEIIIEALEDIAKELKDWKPV